MSSLGVGALGVAGGFVVWIALRRIEAVAIEAGKASGQSGPVKGWGIRDPLGFFLLSAVGLLDTATRYAFLPFLPFLLMEKGAEIESVGFAMTLVFAGGAVGKFACGLLAERFGICLLYTSPSPRDRG